MGYIQTKDLTDISNYCKSRCKKIINEHSKNNIKYYRGQYKGYMYGITVISYISKNKTRLNFSQLYRIIKDEKLNITSKHIKDRDYQSGIVDALYDLMNYLSQSI